MTTSAASSTAPSTSQAAPQSTYNASGSPANTATAMTATRLFRTASFTFLLIVLSSVVTADLSSRKRASSRLTGLLASTRTSKEHVGCGVLDSSSQ